MWKAMRVLINWLDQRTRNKQLARQATTIVQSPDSSEAARAWADVTANILKERGHICSFCINPFVFRERPWEQYFQLRSTLMIPDSAPDPMICDACFDSAVSSYNRQTTNIGTRNDGHSNLALRHLN